MPLFKVPLKMEVELVVEATNVGDALTQAKESQAWNDFANPEDYKLDGDIEEVTDPENYRPDGRRCIFHRKDLDE